ncbi:vanadium-dependent haloperoxidase [Litoreibacter roseus]|uniref:Phosphoesterase n=1 Tax=Litoreibacter roseus TaxID=2601869 RepID=A0A6N6JM06_9RHOB|nr:vanadium-dependent haloperoxidase [Litoreibacter roseus]GFE66997.1 phosphoesterase [Litoreibacter roseus]
MTKPTLQSGMTRRPEAKKRRENALSYSDMLPTLTPINNNDETLYSHGQPASFTKGLKHDKYGLATKEEYAKFCSALITGDVNMGGLSISAGEKARKWESPLAGVYFNDIGVDSDTVAMAPAPKLGRSELCAEMATVYAMALTRDMSFEDLCDPQKIIPDIKTGTKKVSVGDLIAELRKLSWFDPAGKPIGYKGHTLTAHEQRRRASLWETPEKGLTIDVLFRGSTAGAKQGPYISQFMLLGTHDLTKANNKGGDPKDGKISYGLQTIEQAQLIPEASEDYMTTWEKWLKVQQGTLFDHPAHKIKRRIHTPRDLAGYVHFDALYQAYLNACLIMLDSKIGTDGDNPIAQQRSSNSMPFATWGGPHILSLVTEVATRGLRAARRTKFQVHRRARPEVIAARISQVAEGHVGGMDPAAIEQLENMLKELGFDLKKRTAREGSILDWVQQLNLHKNGAGKAAPISDDKNFLLPMAFIEGSPMHPAYGAGHATVAGACVTVLKAFFDSNVGFGEKINGGGTLYAADDADTLVKAKRQDGKNASLSDELDKLAANISIGRNIAGVHYYSDYYDSLRMGERIAIGILEEQMFTYHEKLSLTLTSFDGDTIELIQTDGGYGTNSVKTKITNAQGIEVPRDTWWTRDIADYGIVDQPAVAIA